MKNRGTNREARQRSAFALACLVESLRRHNVPYQMVGGLTAEAYGAYRPLANIDVYVPLATGLFQEIRPFTTWRPERYADGTWDISFLRADYHWQRIELINHSIDPRFFSARDGGCWERQQFDYANSTSVRRFGIEVMPKGEPLRYRSSLGREVDLMDIDWVTGPSWLQARSRI